MDSLRCRLENPTYIHKEDILAPSLPAVTLEIGDIQNSVYQQSVFMHKGFDLICFCGEQIKRFIKCAKKVKEGTYDL